MSKLSNLVPNLNEMMEEYAEEEQESVQVTQTKTGQEEERFEERVEVEEPIEEFKKRKRGAEQKEGKASDWVSEMAYFAWRDKLQQRDFIGKRGFSKWISPFQEVIEKRG